MIILLFSCESRCTGILFLPDPAENRDLQGQGHHLTRGIGGAQGQIGDLDRHLGLFHQPEEFAEKVEKIVMEKCTSLSLKEVLESEFPSILEGEERILIGYHKGEATPQGRILVVDLEASFDKKEITKVRQVDPRTINWLIVDKVKYTVKTRKLKT